MKKFMPIIYVIAFVIGIIFIVTADTGLITSYYPALIAGIIISCFARVFLAIYLYVWHKQSKWVMSIPVDISHILGNLITVIFDYQILRKPLKILSL